MPRSTASGKAAIRRRDSDPRILLVNFTGGSPVPLVWSGIHALNRPLLIQTNAALAPLTAYIGRGTTLAHRSRADKYMFEERTVLDMLWTILTVLLVLWLLGLVGGVGGSLVHLLLLVALVVLVIQMVTGRRAAI